MDWESLHNDRLNRIAPFLQEGEETYDSGLVVEEVSAAEVGHQAAQGILFATDRRLVIASEGGPFILSWIYPYVSSVETRRYRGPGSLLSGRQMLELRFLFGSAEMRLSGGKTFLSSVSGVLKGRAGRPFTFPTTFARDEPPKAYCGKCGAAVNPQRRSWGYCVWCASVFTAIVGEDEAEPELDSAWVEVRPFDTQRTP